MAISAEGYSNQQGRAKLLSLGLVLNMLVLLSG